MGRLPSLFKLLEPLLRMCGLLLYSAQLQTFFLIWGDQGV